MNIFNMSALVSVFEYAINYDYNYVAVVVRMDGYPENEIIINPNENFKKKLEYYQNTYDENLNHKHSQGIRIVDATAGEDLDEIETDFSFKGVVH